MSSDRTFFIRVAGDPEVAGLRRPAAVSCRWTRTFPGPRAVHGHDPPTQISLKDWAQPPGRSWRAGTAGRGGGGFSVWSPTRWRPAPTSQVRAPSAPIGDVWWDWCSRRLIITAIGLAVGAAGALALGRWAAPMLFDTSPRDPLVIGGVAIVMLVTAVERARAGSPRIPD